MIKALVTHLGQVENDLKEKLEKESSAKKEFKKIGCTLLEIFYCLTFRNRWISFFKNKIEIVHLKDKLDKCEVELENSRKAGGFSLLPVSGFRSDANMEEIRIDELNDQNDNGRMLVPKIPTGVSGTALAASLLRDGWSLAKIYEKYQESADALRHEKWGRKHVEAILERVLHEIEDKAELVSGERVEHEKLVEAYTSMSHKLQQALSEHDNFNNTIQKLKRSERDYINSQKEITGLQKQVTVLLKECRDIQLHCGVASSVYPDDTLVARSAEFNDGSEVEKLTFKDINGLVEQNVQLRSLVHNLSNQEEKRDAELRESFQLELQKVSDEAAAKVETVLRSEEQARMIEALHNSVAMYRRLYEEERRSHAPNPCSTESLPEDRRKDLVHLFEGSQEAAKKANEQLAEHARNLEEDLARSKSEFMRDKMIMEVKIASERLERSIKESEHQREETNGVLARNVELSQLLCDYQRRLRETSDSLLATEQHSRKLSMEVSVLKNEKEILLNSEKRATDEVSSLSERLCRLQSSAITVSQLPPDSGLEEPITAYTQAVSNFEEAVGSIPNERLGSSPFPTDTLPIASVMTAAGQQVSSQPLRLTSNQGKATEQRERRFSFPKSTIDARKRKLVRPNLEQSEEPTVDIEMAEVECSTAKEEGKHKESREQETQGSISLPAPSSSSQKRLTSSVSESREELSTQAKGSSDSTPLLKKLKGLDSPPEGVEGHARGSAEYFNEPTSTEGADGGGGISSQVLANMIIDSAKGQDLDVNKEPTQAQPKEPLVGTNQDDELKNESDAVSEEFLVETMELPDDSLVSCEEQDTQQCIVKAKDEREGGELVSGSPEPLEGGESEEGQLEPVAGDAAGVGGGIAETGDGVEFASIEVLNEEKNENSDPVEEAVDVSDKSNSNDHEVERTPLTSSGTPEGSPSIHAETAVSERGTSGATAGREGEPRGETSGSTTIVLGERARQRALLRQAGMGVLRSSPPRGRGRDRGSYRTLLRDGARGTRGPRSRRGHAPGEREQS